MRVAAKSVSLALCVLAITGLGCRKKVTEAHFRLEDGLRVDLVSTPRGEKAAVAILFEIGADHDPPGRSGMARLVEHLFTTAGPAGKPARTIEEVAGQYGHDFHAQTGADYTLYAIEAPAGRLMAEIDDAALRMSRLTVVESDLTREKKRLVAEIGAAEKDAAAAAMNRAAEAVRPTRGGGLRGGIASQIEVMTLDEVEAFRLAHYGGLTARLIIAGHFELDEATKRIRRAFADVPGGKPPQARAPSGSSVTGTLVMGDAPQAMALAVPPPDHKDALYPAFLVLAARLDNPGGAARATRGWTADFAPLARPDVLLVSSPTPAGQPAEPAAAAMRAEVTALVKAPLADAEAERAIARYGGVLGMTPLSAETCAAEPFEAAFGAGRRAQLGIDGAALAQAARAVTQDQVAAAAQRFDGTHSAAVIAGGKAD
jgi:zinc protease